MSDHDPEDWATVPNHIRDLSHLTPDVPHVVKLNREIAKLKAEVKRWRERSKSRGDPLA